MPATSLFQLATKACIQNIHQLESVGDMPYDKVKKVLAKVPSAEQLYTIEKNSKQIIGHDEELWLALIKRDVEQFEKKNYKPSNPAKWYHVYKRYMSEQQASIDADAEILRKKKTERDAELAKKSVKFVDNRVAPKLPMDRNMRREQPAKTPASSSVVFDGRIKKGANGTSFMAKVRKDAVAHAAMRRQAFAPKIMTPVVRAPEDHVRNGSFSIDSKYQLAVAAHAKKASESPESPTDKASRALGGKGLALTEREARLRAAKRDVESAPKETILSDEDLLTADDCDEFGDLFGEKSASTSPPRWQSKLIAVPRASPAKTAATRPLPPKFSEASTNTSATRPLPPTFAEAEKAAKLAACKPGPVRSSYAGSRATTPIILTGYVEEATGARPTSDNPAPIRTASPVAGRPIKEATGARRTSASPAASIIRVPGQHMISRSPSPAGSYTASGSYHAAPRVIKRKAPADPFNVAATRNKRYR